MASFGGTVKLTGESEYRKALTRITQDLKETSSALALVDSQYAKNDNSIETVTKKNEKLNSILEKQKADYESLKSSFTNIKSKYDEQINIHNKLQAEYDDEKAKLEKLKNTVGESSTVYEKQKAKVGDLAIQLNKSQQNIDANEVAMSKLRTQMNNVETSINKTENQMQDYVKTNEEAKESNNKLEKSLSNVKDGFTILKGVISDLISSGIQRFIGEVTGSMDDAIDRLDTMNNFPKVMENLGISAKDSEKAVKKLSDGLQGIPTTLNDGALAVQKFTSKNGDVEKSVDMFLAVNDAILAGGASAQIQSSALEQLSQSYAKGKMDMTEWRSIQTAMPAQLKQVATEMGLTTDELGEMMRQGDNTAEVMDQFIDTIINMDKEGTNGFKSLKEQAKNATGGIKTSMTNLKTAITRGVSNLIEQFDKALKSKGLGGISKIIGDISNLVGNLFKKVGNWMPTIINVISTVFNILNKLKPVIIAVVSAFVAYKTAVTVASTAMSTFNAILNANPLTLVLGAVSALIGLFVTLAKETDNTDKELKAMNEEMNNYKDSMNQLAESREKFLSKGMAELDHYDDLYRELQLITDENGKIKEGYEERAQFITSTLSDALGIEIQIVDGQIQKYEELGTTIQDTIQKKKDQLLLEAHEEEYKKALEEKTTRENEYGKAVQKNKEAMENYQKQLDFIAKQYGITTEEAEKMMSSINDGTIKLNPSLSEQDRQLQEIYNGWYSYAKQLDDTLGVLEDEGELFRQNQEIIYNYDTALEALETNNRETFENIYKDTVKFTGKTVEDNKKTYEESIENNQAYLDDLMANQDKYSADFIENEKSRIEQVNQKNKENYEKANRDLDNQNKVQIDKTIEGINGQLSAIDSKKYEFRDAGNGNVQLYIDGIETGKPIAEFNAQNLVNGVIGQLNKGEIDAKTAGENLANGVGIGIKNKQGAVGNIVASFGINLLNTMKSAFQEHSPSKATNKMGQYLLEGLGLGIEKEEDSILKQASNFGKSVISSINGGLSDNIKMSAISDIEKGISGMNVSAAKSIAEAKANTNTNMIEDFKVALSQMKIEMDDEQMGKFVDITVARTIYS